MGSRGRERVYKNSVHSAQLFCKLETALKIKSMSFFFFKNKTKRKSRRQGQNINIALVSTHLNPMFSICAFFWVLVYWCVLSDNSYKSTWYSVGYILKNCILRNSFSCIFKA